MEYINSFNNRVKSYLYAVNKYDKVLDEEIKNIIVELDIKENDVIVNLGAGGFHLNKFLPNNVIYKPYEFNKDFASNDNILYCNYDKLPIEDNTVDKIVICALLHHFNDEQRSKIYDECNRVLKRGGLLLVADVIKGSSQDYWLNKIVDKYNPNGHKGVFFEESDKRIIEKNNFKVNVEIKNYKWNFDNRESAIDFLKNLFYLNIDDNILLNELNKLGFDDKKIDWKLIYFKSIKN